MCARVSGGGLLRNEQASNSAMTAISQTGFAVPFYSQSFHTSQPVNCPLLKLFKGDFCCWRHLI